eukprot:5016693-Pleurochrysis_carterae.AAC.1
MYSVQHVMKRVFKHWQIKTYFRPTLVRDHRSWVKNSPSTEPEVTESSDGSSIQKRQRIKPAELHVLGKARGLAKMQAMRVARALLAGVIRPTASAERGLPTPYEIQRVQPQHRPDTSRERVLSYIYMNV